MSSGEKIKRMRITHTARRKSSIKKGTEIQNNTARSPKRDLSKQIEKITQGIPLSPKSMRPEEPNMDDKKVKTYFSSLKNVIKRKPIVHSKSPLRETSVERRSPRRFVGRLNL